MRIEDLARDVGIGKGSIYLHFKSKDDIIFSHLDRIVSAIIREMGRIDTDDRPAADKLREMLILRVMARFQAVQAYTQILNEKIVSMREGLLERRKHYFALESVLIAKTIESGVAAGEFVIENPEIAAKTVLDATNSLLPFSLSTDEVSDRKAVQERAERVADLLIDGLRYRCQ